MSRPILLLADLYDEQSAAAGAALSGPSGWLLNQCLAQVGISRRECYATNVFNVAARDVEALCGPRAGALPGYPALVKGKYVRAEFAPELTRLHAEIARERPNVIVALGAAATWALCHTPAVKKVRGAPLLSASGTKVLPTYSPTTVQRDYSLRPILLADLDKARRESAFPEIRRPSRELWLEPTIGDLHEFERRYITHSPRLSVDIETKGTTITCVGVSPDAHHSLVIPFFTTRMADRNYWRSLGEELEAWTTLARWLRDKPTTFQNGLYDIRFLWQQYGIAVPLASEDTMLMHHAYQPELEKGLGFLASVYTDEVGWKFMAKSDTVKREE